MSSTRRQRLDRKTKLKVNNCRHIENVCSYLMT